MRVREQNDINQWFKFFLTGVIETAKSSISTFDQILKLQKVVENRVQGLGSRSYNANLIIQNLYQNPVVYAQKAKEDTNLSAPTVYKLLEDLEKLEILQEVTGSKRGKVYFFQNYIDLFRENN